MAITEAYSGSASIGGTEFSLPAGSTALSTLSNVGMFQLFLDLSALTAAEWYILRFYETVTSSGTKRVFHQVNIIGVQQQPDFVEPPQILMTGWDMTLQLNKGTARTIPWSIRKVG